jgi:3-(3-hydroxy-phenyl)propionate hydroxylase
MVADGEPFEGGPPPGSAAPDAPLGEAFLLDRRGDGFLAVHLPADGELRGRTPGRDEVRGFPVDHVVVPRGEDTQVLYDRWGARRGATYVLRPDSHVLGRAHTVSAETALALVARGLDQADPT